jgi:hypothetical protein
MKPYTYLIGWSNFDIWYYGVRYAKNCKPEDLWSIYFTSSKYVQEFRELYGEPDIIEIRKTFETVEKAQLWETRVLKKMKVLTNDKWLNKNDSSSIKETKEMRSKIWETRRRNGTDKQSKEHIQKRIDSKVKNGTTGKGRVKTEQEISLRIKTLEEKGFGGWKNPPNHGENVKKSRIKQGTWGKNNMKKAWETRRANQLKKSSNVDTFSTFQPIAEVIDFNGSKNDL